MDEEIHSMHGELVEACEAALAAMNRMASRLNDVGAYGIADDLSGFYNGTGTDGRNVQAFQKLDAVLKKAREKRLQ